MVKSRTLLSFFVLLTLVWMVPHAVSADSTRDEMLDIAKELHPPGCTDSMTADYCDLIPAYDLRNEIMGMLAQGKKKDQIMRELVEKYGDRILASPSKKGFNWLAWILPGTGIAAGGIMIGLLLTRWVHRTTIQHKETPAKESLSAEQKQQIQEELKRWV